MEPEERKQFVRAHRTCIFGYNRKNDGPSMSVTYYMMDDPDSIVVSTMAARGKAKAVARNPKVSLCVLDEKWPPTYLQVYCDGRIDATMESDPRRVIDSMMRLSGYRPKCSVALEHHRKPGHCGGRPMTERV